MSYADNKSNNIVSLAAAPAILLLLPALGLFDVEYNTGV